jgi:hypothetical protein
LEFDMTHIIAGRLQQQEQVEHIVSEIINAGFRQDNISTFYLNPPGQHDVYPIGGDRDKSPGAKETGIGMGYGAVGGGAVGAAVGLVGTPVLGSLAPALGALVGAHVGSLLGSLAEMKETGEDEEGGENAVQQRKSGMMVAVSVNDVVQENTVVHVLQSLGAADIELAEGNIVNGDWGDFDPLVPPHIINGYQMS